MTNLYLYLKTITPQQAALAILAISGFAQRSNLPHERLHMAYDGAIITTETEKLEGAKEVIEKRTAYTVKNLIVQGDFIPVEIATMLGLGFTIEGEYRDGKAEPAVHTKLATEKAAWTDERLRPIYEVVEVRDKPIEIEVPIDDPPIDPKDPLDPKDGEVIVEGVKR